MAEVKPAVAGGERPVTTHIVDTLTKKLERYGVVVFYNPAGDMREALTNLPPEVAVVGFGGSYLQVKLAAEERFSRLRQDFSLSDSLLIYVNAPAVADKEDDPLLEYALAGTAYSETLRSLARKALEGRFSREQVEALFDAPSPPTLADLDRWGATEAVDAGALSVVYGTSDTVTLLRSFLEVDQHDERLNLAELATFLKAAVGLTAGDANDAASLRAALWRHVLLSDLAQDAGQDVRKQPPTLRKPQQEAVAKVAEALRQAKSEAYRAWASRVETEESLANRLTATAYRHDTFGFQNTQMLLSLDGLVSKGQLGVALERVAQFEGSFWSELYPQRQGAWRVAKFALCVLQEAKRVTEGVKRAGPNLKKLALGYVGAAAGEADTGWHRLDSRQRELEQNVAALNDVGEVQTLIMKARHAYEAALFEQASKLFAGYELEGLGLGLPKQETTFKEVVAPGLREQPVAYFVMDALRYEMGLELAQLLRELAAEYPSDVTVAVEARASVLPSTTPFGMAALLPGAEAGLGLSAKAEPMLGSVTLKDWAARKKYWQQSYYDGFAEYRIEELPDEAKLHKKLEGGLKLLLVRMQEIDTFGEIDHPDALQVMSRLLGTVRRAVKTVLAAGVRQVVITADHGYLLLPTTTGDHLETPDGKRLLGGRRYWLGHIVGRPMRSSVFTAEDAGLDGHALSSTRLVFPMGHGVYQSSGASLYFHGGPSLQERVVPVITVQAAKAPPREEKRSAPRPVHTLEATLSAQPEVGIFVATVRLVGQTGLLGLSATLPRVRVECVSEGGDPAVISFPSSTTGEYTFDEQGLLRLVLMPKGPFDQRWTLRVVQDTEDQALTTSTWQPNAPEPPPTPAPPPTPPPSAEPAAASPVFGKPLPDPALEPPEELRETLSYMVKVREMPEPDLMTYLEGRGQGRAAKRALDRYLDDLVRAGHALIKRDVSTLPPVYKLDPLALEALG